MRFLVASLLVLGASIVPVAAAQPCYPDACCGSAVSCLLWRVGEALERVAFDATCAPLPSGAYACVNPDPRGACPVWVTDGYSLVCVL